MTFKLDIADLTPEAKDDMIAVVDALADQMMIKGVDLLDSGIFELRALRKLSHATDLFYEFFERDIEKDDEQWFKGLLIALREHAGTSDNDMYND